MDKLNFSLFEFYYDKFVLCYCFPQYLWCEESYKKSFSVYGG